MVVLGVHYEPLNRAINLKSASTLWQFYSSPMDIFILWLSGYDSQIFQQKVGLNMCAIGNLGISGAGIGG